jgi:hypothetical protein
MDFKSQCIALRKRDFTISEIMKRTGRSKTSVYFHIKNIPLSEEKYKEIRRNSGERGRVAASFRKGKALRPHRIFTAWTPKLVSLVAHLMFDGEIRKSCVYNNRSVSLLEKVRQHMKLLYSYEPIEYTNPITGVHRISYHNVTLATFLAQKADELVRVIEELSRECQREFLRAFFDDEGCMDYREKRNLRQIRGYQKNEKILFIVQRLLCNFNIEARRKGRNEVTIIGQENLRQFQKEINFSSGVCINGNRPNSLWKQSLEKKVLLARALKSYKHSLIFPPRHPRKTNPGE